MAKDPTTTKDKFGNTITKGDVVEFVYGGDRHIAPVKAIDEAHGLPTVIVTATAELPAGSVALIDTAAEDTPAQSPDPEPPAAPDAPEDTKSTTSTTRAHRPSSGTKGSK